jgi:hypothetical protein
MHTLIVTLIGFVVLAVFIGVAGKRAGTAARAAAARAFIPVWLVLCIGHLCFGVFRAGYGLADELKVHSVVFGLPALTGRLVSRKAGSVP